MQIDSHVERIKAFTLSFYLLLQVLRDDSFSEVFWVCGAIKIFSFWNEWGNDVFGHYVFHINSWEPRVRDNLLIIIFWPKSFWFRLLKQLKYEILTLSWNWDSMLLWIWKLDFWSSDFLKHCLSVCIVKRRNSSKKFKNNDSKSPPIHSFIMSLLSDHLRGKVFGCSTKSSSLFVFF